ncbi:hypothetical protein [Nostoc sp. JL33]|uniref:hypothetical protein n=1 Tax=Nostoc sp. JL33 TaxID=2815396 RepID=UPI0025EB5790|nr:hypothetical protein [Nostoc sp. JL33]
MLTEEIGKELRPLQHILELGDEQVAQMFRVTRFFSVGDYSSYMNIWSDRLSKS